MAKPGALSLEEWKLLRRHPDVGAEVLSLAPGLRDVAEVVRQHGRHDGSGYPEELKGNEICVEARVVAACGTWVAIRSDRPHRRARTQAEAMTELRRVAGSQLDPRIVEAFLAVLSRSETFALHG